MLSLAPFIEKTKNAGIAMDAVAVWQDGHLLGLSRCSDTVLHNVFSVSKSFLSTAIGMAVDGGILSLEDRPFDFFPELFDENHDSRWERLTLRHLLTMCGGNDGAFLMAKERSFLRGEAEEQPAPDVRAEWLRYAFSCPMVYEPGKCFSYSNVSPYIAGRMLEQKTGMTVRDFLFEHWWRNSHTPLPRWDADPSGHTFPASDLYLDITDMLKLGILYLGNGVYEGRRYLSEEWVAMATAKQAESRPVNPAGQGKDEEAGYGFYFWQTHMPGVFMAYGREGQFIIIHRPKNAVICTQAMHHNVQEILDIVWQEIERKI